MNYFSCRFWYCIEIHIFSKKVKTSFNFSSAPPDFWHEKNWNEICFRFVEGERRKGIFILCWIGMKLYIFLFLCNRMWQISKYDTQWDWFRYLLKNSNCLLLKTPSCCCCYRSIQFLFLWNLFDRNLIATLTCQTSFKKLGSKIHIFGNLL